MLYPLFARCPSPKQLTHTLFGLLLFVFGLPTGARAAAGFVPAPNVPVVRTRSGAVSGGALQQMNAYLGIPYAAPPVGPLRWKPPRSPAAWAGTRAATSFGNHCPQSRSPFGSFSLTEDCLYLNVFVPAGTQAGAKLPVLVWFHGGGFTDGESNDYDPDRLVAQNVIVVTINYRLGYLGFLATSGLDSEAHTHVNYGLLDQQCALVWTRTNIAAFGGDPARTTIFGQSAGGESVFAQLLAPTSAGLFSRALIESGAYDVLSLPSLAAAETQGNAVAAALHCAPRDTSCLRNRSVPELLAVEARSASGVPLTGGPSPAVDGTFIVQSPAAAFAAGAYNHVPLVQGSNHDEFRLFTALLFDLSSAPLSPAEYPLVVGRSLTAVGLGAYTSEVLAQYPLASYSSPDLAFSTLATDAIFSTPAYLTDALLAAQTPLEAYEFSDELAPQDFLPAVSFPYGAAHGSELQFVYSSFTRVAPPLSPAEARLAGTMVAYWTNFAKNATPNGRGLPLWLPFSGFADDMESLVAPQPNPFDTFVPEHNVLFWTAIAGASQLSHGARAQRQYLTLGAVRSAARTLRPSSRLF